MWKFWNRFAASSGSLNNPRGSAKMEIQQILIFAILGAICMLIVTGGAIGMMGGEPDAAQLTGGAVAGGLLGAGLTYLGEEGVDVGELVSKMSGGGGPIDMKVGLPNF